MRITTTPVRAKCALRDVAISSDAMIIGRGVIERIVYRVICANRGDKCRGVSAIGDNKLKRERRACRRYVCPIAGSKYQRKTACVCRICARSYVDTVPCETVAMFPDVSLTML